MGARTAARVLVSVLALGAAPTALAQEPFTAGWRWLSDAPAAAPYVPQSVASAAGGELFFAGRSLAHAGVALYGGQSEGGVGELAADGWCHGAVGPVLVGAMDASRLHALAQFPLPGGKRRTELAVHDATGAVAGGFAPRHVTVLPWQVAGRALLAVPNSGPRLAVALHDPDAQAVHVAYLAGADGAWQSGFSVAAKALRAVACDAEGERFAFALGTRVEVRDGSGALVFQAPLDFASDALALSGDGRTLAVGAAGRVRLWRELAGAWSATDGPLAAPLELPSALALDHDGAFLAVGWWDALTGQAARAETHDLDSGVRVHVHAQGSAVGKQEFISAARVTADGRRAAFAFWGQGGDEPEVVLFDRSQDAPVVAEDLPGSALALALDASGTRLVVAHKATHANDLSAGGGVRLFDTGERDLELAATLVTGGASRLSLRAPAALAAWIGIGAPAAAPLALGGVEGAFFLDPAAPLFFVPLTVQAGGLAELPLVVPADRALSQIEFALQGLTFDGGFAWTVTTLRPPVL